MPAAEINQLAKKGVNLIKKYTPEDEYTLTNKTRQTKQATAMDPVAIIENDTDYAIYVEEWVKGRSYNYYKGWGRKRGGSPFHTGVGAHMFQRALNDLQDS